MTGLDVAAVRAVVLELVCPVPAWGGSLEDDDRLAHRDLPALPEAVLRAEEARVRFRLLIDPDPPRWLLERASAVAAELRRRAR